MTETLRAPREDDAPAVAGLISESWPDPVGPDRVLRVWSSPGFERERDARLGKHCYARVAGLDEDRVWLELHGSLSPALLDWALARAREKGQRFLSGGWSSNEAVLRELEHRGFQLVRHSFRMEIDLVAVPIAPDRPQGIEMRTFQAGDERVFYDLQQEIFEDTWEHVEMPYGEWKHWFLESPAFVPDLWFLVRAGDEPAAFAICHPRPERSELGWIGLLGVRRAWRRHGLGRALLLHAFSEFRARGLRKAGLGVDAESLTGAHRLYERAGMHVVARFDIYEKKAA